MSKIDETALAAFSDEVKRWGADADHWSVAYSALRAYAAALPAEPVAVYRDAIAKAIYDTDPYYEPGEYVDHMQVSPGGHLPWTMALSRDAEFAGDKLIGSVTKWAFDAADAALATIGGTDAERV